MNERTRAAMPHVIAKITALDEIKKISQHILEFRNILALCPAIRILVQKPKIHAVRISPICILNCHAPYYTIFLLRLAEAPYHFRLGRGARTFLSSPISSLPHFLIFSFSYSHILTLHSPPALPRNAYSVGIAATAHFNAVKFSW